jgi:hypothetical protein
MIKIQEEEQSNKTQTKRTKPTTEIFSNKAAKITEQSVEQST